MLDALLAYVPMGASIVALAVCIVSYALSRAQKRRYERALDNIARAVPVVDLRACPSCGYPLLSSPRDNGYHMPPQPSIDADPNP